MQDNSNKFNPDQDPTRGVGATQPRPLFSPTPDIPRGNNLIGDNPFYNYLKPAPSGTAFKPAPQFPPAAPSFNPGSSPIYMGSAEHYRDNANVLWNKQLSKLDPLNPEHMNGAQQIIGDYFEPHFANILTNPNERYQRKEFIDGSLNYLSRDHRFQPFNDLFKLQQKKLKESQEELDRLQKEEEELRKNYNDYGAFQEGFNDDFTNYIAKDLENNLLLDPTFENFPKTAEYLSHSNLNPEEYDKIFNTKKEGFWDQLFDSETYKGLRIFSKRPQAFGKHLEGIDPAFADWARKHYKDTVPGQEVLAFDEHAKDAVNQIYKKLLGKTPEGSDQKEVDKKIEKYSDETLKDIFKNSARTKSAFALGDELTKLVKAQEKLPKSLNEQPKEIDLGKFVDGNPKLNEYLYDFLKANPHGDWKKELRQDLKETLLSYYNQNLSHGNTIDKLMTAIEKQVEKSGGVEKFLIDNIKKEQPGGVANTQGTIADILKKQRDKVDYLKKHIKKDEDKKTLDEVLDGLEQELAQEVITHAHSKLKKPSGIKLEIENQEDDGTIGTPGFNPPQDIQTSEEINEVAPSSEQPIEDYIEGGVSSIFGKVTNAFDKFKTYASNKFEEHKIKNEKATATILERQKQREKKLEEIKEHLTNVVEYAKEKFNNLPIEGVAETIGEKINEFSTFANDKMQNIANDLQQIRENRKGKVLENEKEQDRKLDQAYKEIVNVADTLQNSLKTLYNKLETEAPKYVSKAQDYFGEALEKISTNLSPKTEEELLNKFASQNEYIDESLELNVDTITELATNILTEELKQQDLSFNPETIKEKVAETIKPYVIDDVIIKNESIVEKAKQEVEQNQQQVAEILSKKITHEPFKINITNDDSDDFISFGNPNYFDKILQSSEDLSPIQNVSKAEQTKASDYLQDMAKVLGQIDFITQRMIEQEANKQKTTPEKVLNELQEAITNKPVDELKPIEKIYYNDTLLNDQVKELENNFVDKDNQPIKLNGNKEADLVIDTAEQIFEKAVEENPDILEYLDEYQEKNVEKYQDEISTIMRQLNDDDTISFSDFQYINSKLIVQAEDRFLKKEMEEAKADNNLEKSIALDYRDYQLKQELQQKKEKVLKQGPDRLNQVEEIFNKVQPILEQKILDKEIKPALTNYINFASSNNNDLKSSIKDLGKAIVGLTEQQLQQVIQNLPEEDRNKLISKVNSDLNVLLDGVKEYAPEVMDSFNKVREVQNIDNLAQSAQPSVETIQAVENKIKEILGEKGLTEQAAKDKLIETTGGQGLQNLENRVNNVKANLGDVNVNIPGGSDPKGLQVANGIGEFLKTPTGGNIFSQAQGIAKDATLDLFEIDNLLRILYPIFKNMGTGITNYDIRNPRDYKQFVNKIILPEASGNQIKPVDFAGRYRDYVIPKFEELKNIIKDLPNMPDWLKNSILEPLDTLIKKAESHDIKDPSIDEFLAQYRQHQEAIRLIRQRMEELGRLHAAFVAADSEDDDSMWGSILGAVIGAAAAFLTPLGPALTPSILAGTAAGTATVVGLGALGGSTIGGMAQGMLGDRKYNNADEVRQDMGELDRLSKEYYERTNDAQTKIRQKIIDIASKKD